MTTIVNDQWTLTRYCDLLAEELTSMSRTVTDVDLRQPAPTCPGWSLADVVRQTGEMFRWIEPMVRDRAQHKYGFADVDLTGPATPEDQVDWMVASGQTLLSSLRSADPDRPLWSWSDEKTVRFWARRAYYNTCIHRADIELALGQKPSFCPGAPIDGTEEFLRILGHAADYSARIAMLRGNGETIRLTSPDISWFIVLNPHGYTWRRDDSGPGVNADTTIVAERADDLLLFVWGRLGEPSLSVTGDRRLAEMWTQLSAFN